MKADIPAASASLRGSVFPHPLNLHCHTKAEYKSVVDEQPYTLRRP